MPPLLSPPKGGEGYEALAVPAGRLKQGWLIAMINARAQSGSRLNASYFTSLFSRSNTFSFSLVVKHFDNYACRAGSRE